MRRTSLPIAAICLVGASFAACISAWLSHRAFTDIRQTLDYVDAQTSLLSQLSDAETGERGFIITGDEKYLEPYDNALLALPGVLASMRGGAAGSPRREADVGAAERLARRAFGEFAASVTAVRAGDSDAAVGKAKSVIGKQYMDEARTALNGTREMENAGLASREEVYRLINFGLFSSMLLAMGSAVMLAHADIRRSRRQTVDLHASEGLLIRENTGLGLMVDIRTRDLETLNQRFAAALEGSRIAVCSQDAGLSYTWVHNLPAQADGVEFLGKGDADVLAPAEVSPVTEMKRSVLASGIPQTREMELTLGGQPGRYRLHVAPLLDHGKIVGVLSSAMDVTHEAEARRQIDNVSHELAKSLARLDLALRGSHVTVFALDRSLRYEWISHQVFGVPPDIIVGKTNEEFLPEAIGGRLNAIKRRALQSGRPLQEEVMLETQSGPLWYDLRLEPFRDASGEIDGILGVSVEITERKRRERHVEALLREVTHRSKNLLAVVLAMSRQTGRFATSLQDHQAKLSSRIMSMSRSHELLVDANWERVSLRALAERQILVFADVASGRIAMEGPYVLLKPEAAHNIGMALHELAANALKYGALSTPKGRVRLRWSIADGAPAQAGALKLTWDEEAGPPAATAPPGGYGRTVIEDMVPRSLDATAALRFEPAGVRWSLCLPAKWMSAD